MKAIETRGYSPTNFKPSRVIARDMDGNSVTLSWDHTVNSELNHKAAVVTLRDKMGWKGKLVGGSLKQSMVWVFVKGPTIEEDLR